jgi:hypothetical protein
MECTMYGFPKRGYRTRNVKITQRNISNVIIKSNKSLIGRYHFLLKDYLSIGTVGSTEKREAGMGNGKSGVKDVMAQDFTRC